MFNLSKRKRLPFFRLIPLLLVAVFTLSVVPSAHAEVPDYKWTAALSGIDTLYDGYTALETTNKLEKQRIQSLRKDNTTRLQTVNAAIKNIDKSKIDTLAATVKNLKDRHAPLLDQYRNLGKQISEARKRKDKKNADLLDLTRNKLKPSVEAAKLAIKQAETQLSTAKSQAKNKVQIVKDTLMPVSNLKKQITAENKSITSFNKTRSASYKRYRSAVKSGNAITAVAEITMMITQLRNVHKSQQIIYSWEQQISSAIQSATNKLPAK
ncbi:hypothetical protein [Saccharibacillus sp. JS10]|uniref:hypothetical protein n=1 Tax=Saccharibacillus sp. JS10 TaxID=2950552 RepID=UPI00210D8044|nr:hypothetical protein [Saccharibacillus sp. JS10]MCQ4088267.1 hypothetical protein [Saccharibacillus sp. JS10]